MGERELSPAGEAVNGDRTIRRLVAGHVIGSDGQMEVELVYEVQNGDGDVERIEEGNLVGLVDRPSLHSILEATRFEVRCEWANYDFTPYHEGDPLLIVEARKKE